jgi:tRNA 2-(methylsulfanyl)-N6-isopentenyladenosine37 hydroxylase
MLGLKLETDPRWVDLVETDISEILTDHAWCEQKAASNAISIVVGWPEHGGLVEELIAIAREELEHFGRVHTLILNRNLVLGRERKDHYVNQLLTFLKKDGNRDEKLADRLLFAAMIEARSCERFRVLSEHIKDSELASFYRELMESEAQHYTLFLRLANKYAPQDFNVDARWKAWLDFEGSLIKNYGTKGRIHG